MGLRYTAQCVVESKKKFFLKEITSKQRLKELRVNGGEGVGEGEERESIPGMRTTRNWSLELAW